MASMFGMPGSRTGRSCYSEISGTDGALEFVVGAALLANLWTPLTLITIFPITVIIWLVDVFLLGAKLRQGPSRLLWE